MSSGFLSRFSRSSDSTEDDQASQAEDSPIATSHAPTEEDEQSSGEDQQQQQVDSTITAEAVETTESAAAVLEEEITDEAVEQTVTEKIAAALGQENWDCLDNEQKEKFERIWLESNIRQRQSGSTRHFTESQLRNLRDLWVMCVDHGANANGVAKLADLNANSALVAKFTKMNQEEPDNPITMITPEEEQVLEQLTERIKETFTGEGKKGSITRDVEKKMITAWVRLHRKKAMMHDIPAEVRQECEMRTFRTKKLEVAFQGKHTHKLVPLDLRREYLEPKPDEQPPEGSVDTAGGEDEASDGTTEIPTDETTSDQQVSGESAATEKQLIATQPEQTQAPIEGAQQQPDDRTLAILTQLMQQQQVIGILSQAEDNSSKAAACREILADSRAITQKLLGVQQQNIAAPTAPAIVNELKQDVQQPQVLPQADAVAISGNKITLSPDTLHEIKQGNLTATVRVKEDMGVTQTEMQLKRPTE